MATRMQQRRGTAAQWTSADPILAAGEIGFETDTSQFKIGDGTNHWADLSYFKNLEDLGGTLDDYVPLTQKNAINGVATLDADGNIPVTQLGNLIGDAPTILDTLEEIAFAINNPSGIVTLQINAAAEAEREVTNTAIDDAIAVEVTDRDNAIDAAITTATTSITSAYEGYADGVSATAKSGAESTAQGYVDTHNTDTTNVHGISDTSALVTRAGVETLTNKTISAADNTVTVNLADVIDVTASASEVNILDGVTASTTEINYLSGAASNIQNQISDKIGILNGEFFGTLTGDSLTLNGDLTVGGTTTTVNATDLVVTDPLIYIGEGNDANVVDLGLISSFNNGAYQHAGIVRDATDGVWKLFSSVEDEPTTTVNFSQAVYDTLKVGGIEYADGVQVKQGVPSLTTINQQTASYTPVLTDRDKLIEVNSSSATTITIPANSSVAYPVGTSFDILQTGTGQITIAGAGGVTVNATPGLKFRTQWSSATLFKRATDTWVVFGDLSA